MWHVELETYHHAAHNEAKNEGVELIIAMNDGKHESQESA